MDHTSHARLQKILAGCLDVLKAKVRRAINLQPHAPALAVYSSDGWGAKVRDRTQEKCGESVVTREGQQRVEFALERVFVLVHTHGEDKLFGIPSCPRQLLDGKKGEHFYTCLEDFSIDLREYGARGVSIQMHVFDKLLFAKLMRLVRGRYTEKFADVILDFESCDHDEVVAYCLEWVLGMSCRLHNASKAVEKPLDMIADDDMKSDAHISIQSLINTSTDLRGHADNFVLAKILFVDKHSSESDRRTWWRFCMVPEQLLEWFVLYDPFSTAPTF